MTGSGLVGGCGDESAGCSQRDVTGTAIAQGVVYLAFETPQH